MKDVIKEIDELKKTLDSLRPLEKKDENRLWEKMRLEWNYNSNHLEGNTMTLHETRLLQVMGDDYQVKNNSLKDVKEMQAHDAAVHLIKDWASDSERLLSENDIRSLNELILVKEYRRRAETPEGKQTTKKIVPGQYKSQPNHVLQANGEIFKYTDPQDVSAEMQELMKWYVESDLHPVVKAAFLHYKFVCIHPFDDGNGRVSRLLMNYHLMKNSYPPIIIKSEKRKIYFTSLMQADQGDLETFAEYIGAQLIESLNLAIKAARGEEIEEPEDIDKKIDILNRKLDGKADVKSIKTLDLMNEVVEKTVIPLANKFVRACEKLSPQYQNAFFQYSIGDISLQLAKSAPDQLPRELDLATSTIFLTYNYQKAKKIGLKESHHQSHIKITFFEDHYEIEHFPISLKFRKDYHSYLLSEEEDALIKAVLQRHIEEIERKLNR